MNNKENQEHIKIYDKYMYSSQEKLNTIAIIVVVFVIGFVAGYFAHGANNNTEKVESNNIVIENNINN